MNPLHNPLEGFSPELYLAMLSAVAHSDGLHPIEADLLRQHATNFGLDLGNLPSVPEDLSDVPWATRVLVYRDSLMLAFADHDKLSEEERSHLDDLATRMRLPAQTTDALAKWVVDYSTILDRLNELLDDSSK